MLLKTRIPNTKQATAPWLYSYQCTMLINSYKF